MLEIGTPDARSASDSKLALDQLRLALRNLRPNQWLMSIFAAVVCAIFTPWVSPLILVAWWALVTAGGAPLGYVSLRYLSLSPDAAVSTSWEKAATVSYLLFTVCWSAMGAFFWRQGSDLNHMLIMMLLACTLAGNSALVGASKPLTVVGYSVYGLTGVLLPLREGGPIYDGISVLALLFVGYLAYMSRQIYFTARDMLTLRDDKNELIAALAKSKQESDLARDRAETASRAKSEFLANMSHELRTPLNAILGFAEIIQSGHVQALAGRHQEYAEIIHDSGQHLLALINDILDLARIEAGGLQLKENDIDLACLVSECTRILSAKAEAVGVIMLDEVPPGLPKVYADARALRQVLLNLLGNALKFTPADGRVAVFARLDCSGEFAFGVGDTGIGMAEEDLERVFQSFGQGRHDVITPEKGTGLGLPIVKGLVEAHGGRVRLESRVGEGTTVTVLLPASRIRRSTPLRMAS